MWFLAILLSDAIFSTMLLNLKNNKKKEKKKKKKTQNESFRHTYIFLDVCIGIHGPLKRFIT